MKIIRCSKELNKFIFITRKSEDEYENIIPLPNIAKYKRDLVPCIKEALLKADTEIYKNSMQTLVYKDIRSALQKIK